MGIQRIGILSPGEMGQAVARTLSGRGFVVQAALNGRSERTRELAAQAKIGNVGSIDQLVRQCDVILSILLPGAAAIAAQQVAAAMQATGSRPLYVDCNSIAPQTARAAADFILGAGGRFLDAAIIGPPPGGNRVARMYVAGPSGHELSVLENHHLQIRVVGEEIGTASGLKMCYGAFNEGMTALAIQLLVAAERLGVEQPLRAELLETQGSMYEWLVRGLPQVPLKAPRWVREMEEVAATLESVGLTPRVFQGIAEVLRWVGDAPIAKPVPGDDDADANGGRELIHRLGQA